MPDANGNLLESEKPPVGLLGAAAVPGSTVATYQPKTATAGTAIATGYDPRATIVTGQDTVQGQIKNIIAEDSPLMQQATRRAKDDVAPRGLLNSSLAVGHAREAVIAQALPIAQQDAQTYFQANQKTVDADNAARNFRAGAENTASIQNAGMLTDVAKFNAGAGNEAASQAAKEANAAALARLDADTRTSLANLDATTRLSLGQLDSTTRLTLADKEAAAQMQRAVLDAQTRLQQTEMDNASRKELAEIDGRYRELLQANQNAANVYNSASNAIMNISMRTDLTKAAKDAAIATQVNMLRESLTVTGDIAKLNLSGYFDTSMGQLTPQQIQSQRATLQQAIESARAAVPVWGQDYGRYQAPPGPRQSERTAENFNRIYNEEMTKVREAEAALAQFNTEVAANQAGA